MVLADVPQNENPERGYILMLPRNKNRNEGRFACSPGTINRNEGTSAKTTLTCEAALNCFLLLKFLVILNLWFAKPMVCMRVAFHENDRNQENDENDEDNSDSYKQEVECWISGNHVNHGNDENHGNPGCKPRVPQTTG